MILKDTVVNGNLNITGTLQFGDKDIIDILHPIGSIYMSKYDTNPADLFGGVWERIKDKFLLGAGDAYEANSEGGEETHTLTVAEMPAHGHGVTSVNGSVYSDYVGGSSGSSILIASRYNGYVSAYSNPLYATNTGSTQAHNNMPPYKTVYIWERIS